MTKIDKTDIENINLIIKESKIEGISKIKIKKKDYEIEISSKTFNDTNVSLQKSENKTEINETKNIDETINEENLVKSPMVGVAYLSADPNSKPYVKICENWSTCKSW